MLGVGFPQDRYATLQYALKQRVHDDGLDFRDDDARRPDAG